MSVVSVPRSRLRPLDVSFTGALRYWHRNMMVFRRIWLFGLMAWFAEPVIYLVAMGTGLGAYLRTIQGIRYIDFIAPGLLALSAMYGATFEATWNAYFKMERERVYDAAAATPLSVADVALGELLWSTSRATIYGGAFGVVAAGFGLFSSWWGLLTIPGLALVGLVFGILGLSYTYSLKRIDYVAYYWTMFLTPMFMFAGIFFPLDRLPSWLQLLAWFMPLHHAVNLMRALMLEGDPLAAVGPTVWLVALASGTWWIPSAILRRRLAT